MYFFIQLKQKIDRVYSSMDRPVNIFNVIASYIDGSRKNLDIFSLSELGQYGMIRINDRHDERLILGPVFSGPVSEGMVSSFARGNFIDFRDTELLTNFLNSIPRYTYNQFLSLIAFLHYSINHETFDIMAHFNVDRSSFEYNMAAFHTEKSYTAKEHQRQHDTYYFENLLLSYVRDGETDKLNQFLLDTVKTTELREGTLADSPLRQAKNLLIGGVTMIGKVGAIGGGMDIEEAYNLIDLYIQECEKASSVDAVKLLQYNMVLDFTEHVSRSKAPKNTSREILSCIQFIQNHTNSQISMDDVAAHSGRSRAYITKRFKAETGSSVGQFITQSKLRDAKRLLRYSDKSLTEISNYLCFSSQGYFQTVFKKETGMTPGEYRRHVTL
jgi:AraC-like DNA-binding protein